MQKCKKHLSTTFRYILLPSSHYCSSTIITNNLTINRFLRSGQLNCALDVFDQMPQRDAVSYNSVIAGCARLDLPQRAMHVLKTMIAADVDETLQTYPSLLASCAAAGLCAEGTQLHCRAVSLGFDSSPFMGSALIQLYMNTGSPCLALRVSRELSHKNVAVYNSVLRGLCELGLTDQLLRFFVEIESDRTELNALSVSYLVRGCCYPDGPDYRLDEGRQLHCHVIKTGWAGSDVFVSNALVDMYSAWGKLTDAVRLFGCIPIEDVISWNSVVAVFANHWLPGEALGYFRLMLRYAMRPSVRSLASLLNLSSKTGNLLLGIQIHSFVIRTGFTGGSVHVQSALINMYGKCGDVESSIAFFDEIFKQWLSAECYNSLITSLLHCSRYEKAIELFGLMVADGGTRPDNVTLSAMIKAASSFDSCQMFHCLAKKSGIESDAAVGCSLINAYARAGNSSDISRQIFDQILDPNIACFTALISAYAQNGMGIEGVNLLHTMMQRGVKPDSITFLSVLSGCDHCGLVEEGISMFESMRTIHGIEPDRRHYSCMVSLLGRAGLLDEAMELMTQVGPSSQMWSTLLNSCRIHGNERTGRQASKALIALKPQAAAVCLQITRFYSEIEDSASSTHIKQIMAQEGLWREDMEIGRSSVQAKV